MEVLVYSYIKNALRKSAPECKSIVHCIVGFRAACAHLHIQHAFIYNRTSYSMHTTESSFYHTEFILHLFSQSSSVVFVNKSIQYQLR